MTIALPTDPETERLAQKLAEATGQPLPQIVKQAIEAEAAKAGIVVVTPRRKFDDARVRAIIARVSALPVLDDRSADEIIDYDEFGVPQ
jgi:antitoxin VapB